MFALQSEKQKGRKGGEGGVKKLWAGGPTCSSTVCPAALGRRARVVNLELWSSLQIVKLIALSNCISLCRVQMSSWK